MCGTCGCGRTTKTQTGLRLRAGVTFTPAGSDHTHRTIRMEERILQRNDAIAADNRARLDAAGVTALNLMSSPGAGKTSLLERTVETFVGALPLRIVEGDQETAYDAERIRRAGGVATQINTGMVCHLNASMLRETFRALDAPALLLIENVGNLVCPSLFDLGEHKKIVMASVTEGDDKPLKYPYMYRVADLVLVSKLDLLPHVDFSLERFASALEQVNPTAGVIHLSAKTGDGLATWREWLARVSEQPAGVEDDST